MMYSRMWCDNRKRLNACIERFSHTEKQVDEKAAARTLHNHPIRTIQAKVLGPRKSLTFSVRMSATNAGLRTVRRLSPSNTDDKSWTSLRYKAQFRRWQDNYRKSVIFVRFHKPMTYQESVQQAT